MRIDVLTLFPDMFDGVLRSTILGRAAEAGLVSYHLHDIRHYTTSPHAKVDDRPFGGGPGMVMMCQPICDCLEAVIAMDPRPPLRILLTPQGELLRQPRVEQLAQEPRLLLIAGRYEGIDERAIELTSPLQISAGDYVLSGGEIPAMLLIDAVVRLLPGALGHEDSAREDSFTVTSEDGCPLLDCPHYTRPREFRGLTVPEVLLSGDHGAIERWRHQQRLERTRERRPDLLNRGWGEGTGGSDGSSGAVR